MIYLLGESALARRAPAACKVAEGSARRASASKTHGTAPRDLRILILCPQGKAYFSTVILFSEPRRLDPT
jgi:hypothetical protein